MYKLDDTKSFQAQFTLQLHKLFKQNTRFNLRHFLSVEQQTSPEIIKF